MALTEKQMEVISEALLPLFQYLESQVIIDVANRIKDTMKLTRTSELMAESMQRLGYSPAKIRAEAMKLLKADAAFQKEVAKNTLEFRKKVKKLLEDIIKDAIKQNNTLMADCGDLTYFDDLHTWEQHGKRITDSSYLPQLVEGIRKQTAGTFKNLAMSTGFKTMAGFEAMENLYRRELDKAMIKICTGTFSKEQVIYETIHSLAQSGLRTIDYASGRSMQLDTAVKLAVRTGCQQINAKVMDANIANTGENLIYVSQHWGARNKGEGRANHREWQGKVYYIKKGKDYSAEAKRIGQDKITDLWEATGYSADETHENDPIGLHGYNCRHNHFVWFEGISSLPEEDPEPDLVIVDGHAYDYYSLTQRQRAMERSVRALKREREAMKALGMDTKDITKKIRRKMTDYEDFCKKAKVKPDINRMRYEAGTSDLKKTEAWKQYADSSFREYRILKEDGTLPESEAVVNVLEATAQLPQKAKKALDNAVFKTNSSVGNGYNPQTREIFLVRESSMPEIMHEIGHHLENYLIDEQKVNNLKKAAVQGLTKDDIMVDVIDDEKIFTLRRGKFINRYQTRLYVDTVEEALNPDGTIKIERLGEFVSVMVENYFCNPEKLKVKHKKMYALIEEAMNE